MPNDSYIYGVDLSGKITPVQVRDAIIKCFSQAQEELIEYMRETTEVKPEKIEKMYVDSIIEKAFAEVDGDFKNPTKETLIQVVMKLKIYAAGVFRDSKIIEKHAGEIKQLIDKLD
jgi:predicted transcriptional regulator YheO